MAMDNNRILRSVLPFLALFTLSLVFAFYTFFPQVSVPTRAQETEGQDVTKEAPSFQVDPFSNSQSIAFEGDTTPSGQENSVNALFNHILNIIDTILYAEGLASSTEPLTDPADVVPADSAPKENENQDEPAQPEPTKQAQQPTPPPQPKSGTATSRITAQNVSQAMSFFSALKEVCPVVSVSNYKNCLATMNTANKNIPNEQMAKNLIAFEISELSKPPDPLTHFQCGSFTRAIYTIFTGRYYSPRFNGPPQQHYVKYLAEPFDQFTYYKREDTTPALGDLVKWTSGTYGHIAVVVSVLNDDEFEVIHANISDSRRGACPGCLSQSKVNRNEAGLAGFYRLK